MDISVFTVAMQDAVGHQLPRLLGALAIFALGWLIAVAARAAIRRLLNATRLNERISSSAGSRVDAESPVAVVVFWLVLLAGLVAALGTLDLSTLSSPLATMLTDVLRFLPRVFAAAVLSLVAWVLASLIKLGVNKALDATSLDEKLSAEAGMAPMAQSVGNVIFWLVILLFLPAILGALQMTGLLEPVKSMLDKLLAMAPNILAAILIGVIGWVLAKVLRGLVTNLLAAGGIDNINSKIGLDGGFRLSKLAGTVVYILIFVPSLISALDALKIEAISGPATRMLSQLLEAVPHIVAAAIILTLTWFVARFASELLKKLLEQLDADSLPAKIGLGQALSGSFAPSRLASGLLMFFAMLFAVVEAANQLGFGEMRSMLGTFTRFGADIVLGSVIMLIGFWLSNVAFQALSRAESSSGLLANIARFAILGLVIAMGLRAMGVANEIVFLAFGLTLGAVAVAAALAFGLGGREAAGKLLDHWVQKISGK